MTTAMLSLADVLEALTGSRLRIRASVISEAAIDSRQVIPGSLFVALPGERVDGHDYISDAFKHGASFALVQKEMPSDFHQIDIRSGKLPEGFKATEAPLCIRVEDTLKSLQKIAHFWRRKLDLRVIGITGSVGKSTTKELVSEVLSTRYVTMKNPGNLNNEIGLPLTILQLGPGYQRAVLEMGFYVPGEITFLCDIALPQVGIITNVGTVHAERAGSQESIARGKAELVEALPPAPDGIAILNYDDPWVRPMAEKTSARVIYYGLDPHADLWADEIESYGLEGIKFRLHYQNEVLHLRVPLIGEHSVHTALRATAAGLAEGLSWSEIIYGLKQSHAQLRLVAVHTKNGALILDDTYNASPESTLAALNLLNKIDGRKIAVLGDMLELGPYEKQGHEKVGIRVSEVAEKLVAIGELSKLIVESARQSGLPSSSIYWFPDVQPAITLLGELLKEGDIALVKGSHGLRMDRIVAALEVDS
jgi:UDP-N-acetylmuramoyl-tripeptide--D-alanyl-D-alanine ligase